MSFAPVSRSYQQKRSKRVHPYISPFEDKSTLSGGDRKVELKKKCEKLMDLVGVSWIERAFIDKCIIGIASGEKPKDDKPLPTISEVLASQRQEGARTKVGVSGIRAMKQEVVQHKPTSSSLHSIELLNSLLQLQYDRSCKVISQVRKREAIIHVLRNETCVFDGRVVETDSFAPSNAVEGTQVMCKCSDASHLRVAALLRQLDEETDQVVEAVARWRKLLRHPVPFHSEEGKNYLLKIALEDREVVLAAQLHLLETVGNGSVVALSKWEGCYISKYMSKDASTVNPPQGLQYDTDSLRDLFFIATTLPTISIADRSQIAFGPATVFDELEVQTKYVEECQAAAEQGQFLSVLKFTTEIVSLPATALVPAYLATTSPHTKPPRPHISPSQLPLKPSDESVKFERVEVMAEDGCVSRNGMLYLLQHAASLARNTSEPLAQDGGDAVAVKRIRRYVDKTMNWISKCYAHAAAALAEANARFHPTRAAGAADAAHVRDVILCLRLCPEFYQEFSDEVEFLCRDGHLIIGRQRVNTAAGAAVVALGCKSVRSLVRSGFTSWLAIILKRRHKAASTRFLETQSKRCHAATIWSRWSLFARKKRGNKAKTELLLQLSSTSLQIRYFRTLRRNALLRIVARSLHRKLYCPIFTKLLKMGAVSLGKKYFANGPKHQRTVEAALTIQKAYRQKVARDVVQQKRKEKTDNNERPKKTKVVGEEIELEEKDVQRLREARKQWLPSLHFVSLVIGSEVSSVATAFQKIARSVCSKVVK